MNDTQKMLQAILSGQSTVKQDLMGRIDKVEKKLDGKIDNLEQKVDKLDIKIDKVDNKLTERLDKIGKQLAYLEDDTPTREEFDKLEQRIDSLSP